MGRVASYKKVKTFDKSYSGGEYVWGTNAGSKSKKRSLTAEKLRKKKLKRRKNGAGFGFGDGSEGLDIPPEKDDFNLDDFVVKKRKQKRLDHDLVLPKINDLPTGRASSSSKHASKDEAGVKPSAIVKNEKVKIGNTSIACHIPVDDQEEIKAAKMLQVDPRTGKSTSIQSLRKSTIEGRREGESMNAFHRRLKEETKNALAENYKNSKPVKKRQAGDGEDEEKMTKAEKRREYSKMRKKKKKGKLNLSNLDEDDAIGYGGKDHDDGFITGEEAAARISFLEQAEQPPVFNQLPRGAHNKLKLKMKGVSDDGSKSKKPGKIDEEGKIKAEQDAMEIMRRKVQAQYALMKAKRRQGGTNFHL